ncbi:mechanosensitive ion channel family protein [Motiliproteus coralliicola]|uniref:Mechanosensitive ion channel family protein n=1 Tax=Motiliproteus coralliicola TaxID=2283196 RepID=A0A369WU99_9GAMM|nr:mechanosensitive ion channel family protein [Motiliproteus coralliicola]RDE24134.1 mechanosensitive ion channel family protein [Motiliproteus coralliicola]
MKMELQTLWDQLGLHTPERFWIIEVFIVVFITLLASFFLSRLFARLAAKLEQTRNIWDDVLLNAVRRPATFMIWVVGLGWAAQIIDERTQTSLLVMLEPAQDVIVIALLAWFMLRLVRGFEEGLIDPERSKKPMDQTTAHAVSKLLRASVIITAVLVVLQSLGYSISGVLAFGGIGGIAVGFAAKDLLANFFGGLMIYLDRPFAVGDWVRSPDQEIEGTVEYIGWRQTRIRTFDKRPLYVPNSTFASISVENPSRMTNRRIYETIGIRYDDAAQVKQVVDAVRQMLREHPDIDTRQTLIVNLNAFAPSSLDFFIYCFTKTTDWVQYHGIKEDVMLRIIELVEQHRAEMAYPTQTLHLVSPQMAGLNTEIPAPVTAGVQSISEPG